MHVHDATPPCTHKLASLNCRVVHDSFEPTMEDSDTGWVTGAGMGAFQVRELF